MNNNIKFSIALENLNKKIAELNIKISKDLDNILLKNELSILLYDRDILFKGTDIKKIESFMDKYGNK